MRRWVRTAPLILVGVCAVTLASAATELAMPAGATPAGAAATSTSSLLAIAPVGAAVGSKDGSVVALDPGASAVRSFVVTNRSAALVLTVHLDAVDATRRAGGTVHYAGSAPAGSPATWLTLSDVVATLEPRGSLRVSVTVTPPANAAPGDVSTGVVASVEHAVRADDQTTVPAKASVTLPVVIRLKGAATALVSIVDARVVRDGAGQVLDVTFQNAGATPNVMTGRVDVRGPTPHSQPIRASIASLTQTTLRVPFAMPAGAKTVPIAVVATDAGGDEATWSGSVGLATKPLAQAGAAARPASAVHRLATTLAAHGASLPRLALLLVALALAGAAIWFAAELRRNRAARRSRKVAAPAPSDASAGRPVPVSAPAPVPVLAPGAAPASTVAFVHGAGVDGKVGAVAPMDAVAVQLGALVEAIDRLVIRLDDAPVPEPRRAADAATAPPMAEPEAPSPAPPTVRGPEPAADDRYDWPTEAQLEQFAARRRAASGGTS